MSKGQKWYNNNLMMNHPGKTEIIMFNPKKKNDTLKIKTIENYKEKIIESKDCIKILGLLIDNKLNWRKHIKSLEKISMNTTRKVHRINHFLPTNLRVCSTIP